MWIAKITVPSNPGMLVAPLAKKHKVSIMGYPLSFYENNSKFFSLNLSYILGDEKNKKEFLKDLKKDKRTIKLDIINNTSGLSLMQQNPVMKILHDPLVIHTKPVIIDKNGTNTWEIASWDRTKIMDIAKLAQSKILGGKLVYIKNSKVNTITFKTLMPKLTSKQQRAIELAIEHGYYGYPRKITMEKLAKIMKVSYSTYEFHLRNAEKKLIPNMISNIS